MKKLTLIAVVCGVAGCAEPESAREAVPPVDPPLLELNGELLTLGQFERYYELAAARRPEAGAAAPVLLAEFVENRLLRQAAEQAGVEVEAGEVDRFLASIGPLEPDTGLETEVEAYLQTQRFVQSRIQPAIDLSLQDALDYYARHEEEFVIGHQAKVLEILVDDVHEARRLERMLEGAESRAFRTAAREWSQGATAERGGDLGYFEQGDLPPDFEKFIFALKPGQVSGVFPSPHGYHLFLLEEWIPAHAQKFHEVQEEIFRRLRAGRERAAMRELVNQLLESASIELYDSRYRVEDIRRSLSQPAPR